MMSIEELANSSSLSRELARVVILRLGSSTLVGHRSEYLPAKNRDNRRAKGKLHDSGRDRFAPLRGAGYGCAGAILRLGPVPTD